MPPPPRGDNFQSRKIFEDAANDQPAQRQAQIEWPADARRQPIFLHPLLAEAEMRRMDHHRNIEILNQLPEWPRFVVVRIMALVTGMNEYALEAELPHRPLGLLEKGRSAARQDGGKAVERSLVFLLHFGGVVAGNSSPALLPRR